MMSPAHNTGTAVKTDRYPFSSGLSLALKAAIQQEMKYRRRGDRTGKDNQSFPLLSYDRLPEVAIQSEP